MRYITTCLLILLTLSVHHISIAQTPPNWGNIEFEVSDPGSKYYYPRLLERYKNADTTLTFDDYYRLYYGYPTQQDYKPLLPNPTADSLEQLFGRRTSPTFETFEKAARLAEKTLQTEPFNLRDINALAYALNKMGYIENATRQMRKLTMIEKVITSTGTGLTEDSPWYITYPNHAEDIIALRGLNLAKTIVVSTTVEYLQVQSIIDKKYRGYYFNYAEIYKRKPDYLENAPKQKRRMEINGTRPWELKRK